MSAVRVAIPVFRAKRRFHLLKGRPWSSAEHLVLQSLVKTPRTAGALSDASKLPRRVVIEILIRLMKVGWVEVSPDPEGVVFRATVSGTARAADLELPSPMKSAKRWMAFFVDRVTGTAYRGREFQAFPKSRLIEKSKQEIVVWLQPDNDRFEVEPNALFSNLTDEDESIIGFDPNNDRPSDLYAIVTVRNENIEGLPARAPPELSRAILEAAASIKSRVPAPGDDRSKEMVFSVAATENYPVIVDSAFSRDDLVLGGRAHLDALKHAVRLAATRVIVHSTFVSEDGLQLALPLFKDAALRGVRVDVLWGQGDNSQDYAATLDRVRRTRKYLQESGLDGLIVFHPFSTHSHAKIVVADDMKNGAFTALVGSCNWLSSGFTSFDASVRAREPRLVSEVLNALAKLSRGRDGNWSPLTENLAKLAVSAAKQSPPKGMKVPAALVLGAHHGSFVRQARDNAQQRIFVASHRLSEVGNRAVIVPAIAAAQDSRGVSSRIYYNRTSGQMRPSEASDLILTRANDKVILRAVHDPRLHAKILAWDDDSVVISSLNWLSADTSPNHSLEEIGIYIGGGRAADHVVRVFDNVHVS